MIGYQQNTRDKNLHTMVQQMVDESFQQQQKRRKNAGNLHLASEVARKPVKKEEDDDENIEYGLKDDNLIDFQKLQMKATPEDDSDDEDIYT